MATVTGFTADRMKEIEDTTVVSGLVDANGDLILSRRDQEEINAGRVIGPEGPDGAPAGSILAWPALGIPNNWLECNGQAVDREIYSDLYAIIGTQYGIGDGSTTFNVPDLRGRVVVGLNDEEVEFNTLGEIGGEKEHLLTKNQLPEHTHRYGPDGTGIPLMYPTSGSTPPNVTFLGINTSGTANRYLVGANVSSTPGTITEPQETRSTGSNFPVNNLQPYITEKYIIKASGNIGELNSTVESVLLGRVSDVEERVLIAENDISNLEEKTNASEIITDGVISNTADFTLESYQIIIFGPLMTVVLRGVTNSAYGDTTTKMCTIDLDALGVSLMSGVNAPRFILASDSGNSLYLCYLDGAGDIYSIDATIGRTMAAAGNHPEGNFTIPVIRNS